MRTHNPWGIGATDVTKYGTPGSHRPQPYAKRRGEEVIDEQVLSDLAAEAGIGIKRLKRDLHVWRACGKRPSWADQL